MGRLKTKAQKKPRGGTLGRVATKAAQVLTGKGSKGGKRRNRGPTYWANKVLVEKLKKRYHRLKYGGAR